MDFDRALERIGEFGPCQLLYVSILSLLRCVGAMHVMQYTFLRRPIPFKCSHSDDVYSDENGGNFTQCDIQRDCGEPVYYNSSAGSAIMSEWNLICERFAINMYNLTFPISFPGGCVKWL